MSLATRCPVCGTAFRVQREQLAVRGGRVRCGKCATVFDGVASLVEEGSEKLALGRLWIGATWHEPPASAAAIVRIDPGLAFGTGSHPSTRLVLEFLGRALAGGERVLDYGCGSGILAIAAAKLGAASVDAVDVDTQAVETTAMNARLNQVEVRALVPEALPAAPYDLVLSNILFQPLVVLAPLLAARAVRGGRIALAGILETQAGELIDAYAPWFDAASAARGDGWALVTGVRR